MTKHGGGDGVDACAPKSLTIPLHSIDDCDYL